MFELKLLSPDAVSAALERVERYRLLNESRCAESICRDVLAVDPGNTQAQIELILSLTDQFSERSSGYKEARESATALSDEYNCAYYSGIVRERRAHSTLRQLAPGAGNVAYSLLREAMDFYETAETLRPPGNDDAILRWNTCARVIMDSDSVCPDDRTVAAIDLE
jgi:hypothetical protein